MADDIAKRTKTARLRRKTKPGGGVILYVRPELLYHIEYQPLVRMKYRVPTMQNPFWKI